MERGRVLQVVPVSLGVPHQVLPIAKALAEEGWKVDVACSPGPELSELQGTGIGHVSVGFSRRMFSLRHLSTLVRLTMVLKCGEYDIVHLHGPIPAVIGRIAAVLTSTEAIHHVRGTFLSEGINSWFDPALIWIYPKLERMLEPITSWTLTLGREDARDFISCIGYAREEVTALGVSGCGLDMDIWDPERYSCEDRESFKDGYGIPPHVPIIGFVGRIVREKGVFELLEAAHRLHTAGYPFHVLVVGDVPLTGRDKHTLPELKDQIEQLGLAEDVTMTGYLDNPAIAMSVMDVLTLPSYREGFPGVLVEAGALGIPVVAAASRGARQAVRHGKTGLLVPIKDGEALANAVIRLIEDPSYAEELGKNAREIAEQEFGRGQFIETILSVYANIEEKTALSARR